MIYATARTDHYIPIRNLSATHKHYTTDTNLGSKTGDTYQTHCNLPTAMDLPKPGTPGILSSTNLNPLGPYDNSWAAVQPFGTQAGLPADRPPNLAIRRRSLADHRRTRLISDSSLGSTITDPLQLILSAKAI